MGLFSREKSNGKRTTTSAYGSPAVASAPVSEERESDGVRAHRFAGMADERISDAEVAIDRTRKFSLDASEMEKQLGFARVNLAKARVYITNRDLIMAKGAAETAYRQAVLAKERAEELVAKQQGLAVLCQKAVDLATAIRPAMADALVRGKQIRKKLRPQEKPVRDWKAFRWLDLAAELRVKQADDLLSNVTARLARGELDEIDDDAGRAIAWLDQAGGYLRTLSALEQFMVVDDRYLADKATTAHELMCLVNAVFRNSVPGEAMKSMQDADFSYGEAKGPDDIKRHKIVLENSLAVVDLTEQALLARASVRFGKRERNLKGMMWTTGRFPSAAYRELCLAEHANMLVDLFPRALSAKERSALESGYRSDGLNCPCCP